MADLYPDAEAGFAFGNEVLKEAIKRIYERKFNPMTEIDTGLFNAVWDTLNIATNEGYGERTPTDPDFDFYHELRYNNAVFSAFKVHRAQNDMAKLLLDSNGNLKSFEKWSKEVKPIASHQFDSWLRTEYDTAVLRARLAADWKQFEREADVLPNIRWIPSTSIHPGADHRIFWNTVRPIDDPFWSQHRPGDRWNCKCGLENTDDPVTDIPYVPANDKPSPGLENRPEKDAKLFSDTHPYIKHAYKGAEKAVKKTVQSAVTRRMKELRLVAKPLTEKTFSHPDFPKEMTISNKGIKEWINQPHEYLTQKNELILGLENLIRNSIYRGSGKDVHRNDVVVHLFEVEILGNKSWIIVREFFNGRTVIHSISDNPSILDAIKKKPKE